MSLATRCTTCTTVFRVVQDQLKVSEGWVRCGRCNTVFNALEGLFDLGREAPPDWEATTRPGDGAPADEPLLAVGMPLPAEQAPEAAGAAAVAEEPFIDPVDAHLFGPRKRTESAPKPAGQIGARDRLDFSDARFDSDLFAENASALENGHAEPPVTDVASLETTIRPEFIRRAESRARWRSAPARSGLAFAALVAALALLTQFGHHYRDPLAAQWPALRPALAAWCGFEKCTLDAPRRIDDVLVESTALTRAAGIDGFVLSVNLRNRAPFALALPSIDLNLTDGNGRLVARRALAPVDFRASGVLQAGAEAALQATLTTGSVTVAGYTVEIFYP